MIQVYNIFNRISWTHWVSVAFCITHARLAYVNLLLGIFSLQFFEPFSCSLKRSLARSSKRTLYHSEATQRKEVLRETRRYCRNYGSPIRVAFGLIRVTGVTRDNFENIEFQKKRDVRSSRSYALFLTCCKLPPAVIYVFFAWELKFSVNLVLVFL